MPVHHGYVPIGRYTQGEIKMKKEMAEDAIESLLSSGSPRKTRQLRIIR